MSDESDEESCIEEDFLYACRTGETAALRGLLPDPPLLRRLIEYQDPDSLNTGLHMAAANGHADTITFLLENSRGPNPGTPEGKCDADPFADQQLQHVLTRKNQSGNTALHWAALNGQAKATEILAGLQHDLGIVNSAGQTAYDAAVGARRVAVAELLVRLAEARVAQIDVDLEGLEGDEGAAEEAGIDADADAGADATEQELKELSLGEKGSASGSSSSGDAVGEKDAA